MYRVTLFSDEPILAVGLASVLSPLVGIELGGTYRDLDTLLDAIHAREPDVLLIDFKPEENFAVLLEIRNRVPGCKILLWVHSISMEVAYHAMRLGVRGILRRTVDLELLLKCLQKVALGEYWFEKELAIGFMQAKPINLTPRESQLVALVSEGLKNKEIATALAISESTVRIYCSALFRKLGIKDRYELAIYGMKNMSHRQHAVSEGLESHGEAPETGVKAPQNLRFLVLEKPPARSAQSIAGNGRRPSFPRKALP
jgi:DNA-binding NarL/FixJ family response regulator